MLIETETDYNTLAAHDAEQRDLSGVDLPTRAEVENGKPTPKDAPLPTFTDDRLSRVILRDDTHAARQKNDLRTAPAPFVIDDEQKAGWVLRKFAQNEAEIARVKAQAAARIAELETDGRTLHSRFDEPLRVWAQGEAERRRRKTITTLDGTLSFRTVPAKLVISDGEAAFVNARTVCPDAIIEQTTVRLDTAAYLKFAEATGDLTGIDRQPEREAFKIDTGSAKPKGKAASDEAGD